MICYTCTICGYQYEIDAPDQDDGDTKPSDNPYTGIDLAAIRVMSLLGAVVVALLLSKKCRTPD